MEIKAPTPIRHINYKSMPQNKEKTKQIISHLIDIEFLLSDKYFITDNKKLNSIKRCINSIKANLTI